MSKAILVLEMPEKCEECPLRHPDKDGGTSVCFPMRQILLLRVGTVKPDWCPLGEMPPRTNVYLEENGDEWTEGYVTGYNACLRDIEGNREDD